VGEEKGKGDRKTRRRRRVRRQTIDAERGGSLNG